MRALVCLLVSCAFLATLPPMAAAKRAADGPAAVTAPGDTPPRVPTSSDSKGSKTKSTTTNRTPKKQSSSKRSKKKRESPAYRLSGKFALRFVYDDNIIHYSDEDLLAFTSVPNTGRYEIATAHDWIVRPRLETEIRTKRLTGKTLQATLRLSAWLYGNNSIKNNQSIALQLKHPGFGGNLYLDLYYSPRSYLRTFLDRPPYMSRATPLQYTPFEYTSNSVAVSHWRWLYKKLVDGKFLLQRSVRYYNQPFMENDNWEWRIGGYVRWKFQRRLRLRLEYLYSDVRARARDSITETRDNSDDGDASYQRDSYEAKLYWRPRRAISWFRQGSVAFQYQAYYFTTDRAYYDDPYHVGRKDQVYRIEFTADSKKIWGPVTLEGGYRFSERTSTAAFDSDNVAIGEDKDYTDNRFWIGAEYPF
ncbi:MAG: hypothetical protein PVF43_03895 [Candidatus Eiseniibacteriota bacterium]